MLCDDCFALTRFTLPCIALYCLVLPCMFFCFLYQSNRRDEIATFDI
jgi:hypothetical protein